jgi:hypothetical protein
LVSAWTQSEVLQLHGFAQEVSDPDAYVSDGSKRPGDASAPANRLAATIRKTFGADAAASCNDPAADGRLCDVSNVQGRYSNGAKQPCQDEPASSTDRFLHVEQAAVMRNERRVAFLELLRQFFP